jgi:hypothetical protein
MSGLAYSSTDNVQMYTQKRGINLQQKCIPWLARHFFQFSVIRTHSQESEPITLDEEAEVGTDSDETVLQPSLDQPSGVFQIAAGDPAQTHGTFSAPAISQEAAFSFLVSFPS